VSCRERGAGRDVTDRARGQLLDARHRLTGHGGDRQPLGGADRRGGAQCVQQDVSDRRAERRQREQGGGRPRNPTGNRCGLNRAIERLIVWQSFFDRLVIGWRQGLRESHSSHPEPATNHATDRSPDCRTAGRAQHPGREGWDAVPQAVADLAHERARGLLCRRLGREGLAPRHARAFLHRRRATSAEPAEEALPGVGWRRL
jgi:hypothetical protein